MATTKEHQPASVTKKNTLDGKSPFLYRFLTRLTSGLTANAAIFGIIFFFFMVAVLFLLYRESKYYGFLEQLMVEKIASKSDSAEELQPPSACITYPEYYHAEKSQDIGSNEQEDSFSCRRPTLCKHQSLGKCNNEAPNCPPKETSDSQPFERPHVTTRLDNTMDKPTIPLYMDSLLRGNLLNCSVEEDSGSKAPSFPTKEVPDSRQFQTPFVTENVNDVCKSPIPEESNSVQMKIISGSADEEDISNINRNIPLEAKSPASADEEDSSSSKNGNVPLEATYSSWADEEDINNINGNVPLEAKSSASADEEEDISNINGNVPLELKSSTSADEEDISNINGNVPLELKSSASADEEDSSSISGNVPLEAKYSSWAHEEDINNINGNVPLEAKSSPSADEEDSSSISGNVPLKAKYSSWADEEDSSSISRNVPLKAKYSSWADEEDININGNVPLEAKSSSCESITLNSSDVLNFSFIPRFSSPLPNKTLMEVMHEYFSSIDDNVNIGKHSDFIN
ncbi:uncharacterized protein LOC115472814 isoform X2 [Microcaecilia unicolor]|nr:uncharacterized protein LOC115472814 isoform X2 [Microcaecilia unicolor]